jgi:hypothetical protein
MAAPKGNQFWKLRSKHGVDKLFASPELLWEAACEYFEWCDENPHTEEKAFAYQGQISKDTVTKMRAYSLGALCLYLGCSESYFRTFKCVNDEKEQDYLTVIAKIEQAVREQQFSGAAADLLNANIISRTLGLMDKTDVTSGGEKLNQVQIFQLPSNDRDDS